MARSASGGFLVADTRNHRVREVLPGLGVITTVAGTGQQGWTGDGTAATLARLSSPSAVAPTADGGFLVADSGNSRIRKVSALGVISNVAGTGFVGAAGDGGQATAAELSSPFDVAVTDDGGFLIADTGNSRIRKVAPDGTISTVAGNGTAGFSGDGGVPTAAQLNRPEGVESKGGNDFLIADSQNHRVRMVQGGIMKTRAGNGTNAFAGDGGDPQSASVNWPVDVMVDGPATFVLDHDNNRVRLIGTLPDSGGGDPVELPPVDVAIPEKESVGDSPFAAPTPPEIGEKLNAAPSNGEVRVRVPGRDWLVLPDAASIPFGSLIDATRGSVTLTSARDATGALQSATFSGATFKIAQGRGARPVTELALRGGDFSSCWRQRAARSSGTATTSARRRPIRRLWGSGKGRFRTRGRHGAATVRGTIWLTEDSCAGTRVSVRRGKVAVKSFRTGRTVLVRAGRTYLAPWRRPQAAARRSR